MNRILLAFAAFCCLSVTSAQIMESPKYEVRAVWMTTLGGLDWPRHKASTAQGRVAQQRELCEKLDRLKRDGINLVYFQVRTNGMVLYPSRIEPWDLDLTGKVDGNPGYDPLKFAIEECHRRGMECHAWLKTIPVCRTARVQTLGRKGVVRTHPKLVFKQDDMYYLNPQLQGTADYLESLCREIVEGYDVDGMHFDYIRYPEGTKNDRQQWRRDNITHIVGQLSMAIRGLKPWVKISCSPVGKYADVKRYSARGWTARDAVFQDAALWMKEGWMDMISPMMYFRDNNFYPFAADWQERSCGRIIAPGLGVYFLSPKEKNWNLTDVTRELCFLRQSGIGGAAYFRAQFLLDNVKGLEDWLRLYYYNSVALVPPTKVGGDVPDSVLAKAPKKYVLYASKRVPVDVMNPDNVVQVFWGRPEYSELALRMYGQHIRIVEEPVWIR